MLLESKYFKQYFMEYSFRKKGRSGATAAVLKPFSTLPVSISPPNGNIGRMGRI